MKAEAAPSRVKVLEEALRPITMQDVRLALGEEGRLSVSDILSGCNAELRRRAALSTSAPSQSVKRIYVRWADDGVHIRKWSHEPFEHGEPIDAVEQSASASEHGSVQSYRHYGQIDQQLFDQQPSPPPPAENEQEFELWSDLRDSPEAIVACGERWKQVARIVGCQLHGFDDGRSAAFLTPDGHVIEIGPKFRAILSTLRQTEQASSPVRVGGEEMEQARVIACRVLQEYGEGDGREFEAAKAGTIWNDHPAVQSALAGLRQSPELGEPFAWFKTDVNGKPAEFASSKLDADVWTEQGYILTPVYRSPDAAERAREGR